MQMMMYRISGRRHSRASLWFAVVCAIAFLGASNYCNVEAFAAHPTPRQEAHHSATAEHHDEQSTTPAHHHDDGSLACCSAIQAITASKFEFRLASAFAWQFHPPAPQSSWFASVPEPSRTASGLSPPAREPTPARPFYRTTFASHAPPVSLSYTDALAPRASRSVAPRSSNEES